ncbi:cysteine-rich repeat secretory protein 34-like [Raphanus sativus]|uniref:Cysteine-rich repeat secretory protein 34-like n=1 Tax=Raphanus sativus TaxID=3726 RepID=A0A6J0LJS2_RAPSA|nr:cysteine-rich repeat secretory protein 34-like [Raphanus sativus]
MKSSYPLSKQFSFSILAIQFLIIHSVSSLNLTNDYLNHKCLINQGKYNFGSEFEQNLNQVFHHISTSAYNNVGFAHTTIGTTPQNSVTATLQCRGDSYGSKCRACVAIAIAEFLKRCPRNKGGIIWYDQCFLRVSMIKEEVPIKTNFKNIFSMHNPNNVRGDATLFAKRAIDFFYELTLKVRKTTNGGLSLIFYAAGKKKIGKNKLYAMVQCVGLTLDCKSCLIWSITTLFKNGEVKEGARVLGTNCDVRYELYPFLRS